MPTPVDEIRSKIDLTAYIGSRVPLTKRGKLHIGRCPFHAEDTPSFTVYPNNSYYCFGCQAGGDVFSFVMEREGLEFREALESLAAEVGVELPRSGGDGNAAAEKSPHLDRVYQVLADAAALYHTWFWGSRSGQEARDYVADRGLGDAIVNRFQLGYTPDRWDALLVAMTQPSRTRPTPYRVEDLVEAGLVVAREDGSGYYDRFRRRLMFPIRDRKGRVVSFGGRALADGQAPKYLNGPETAVFEKSKILYGFDLARDPIRRAGKAIIVEGYVDVVMAHQNGQETVVAPLGTALGPEHVRALNPIARTIVLAFDPDRAGQAATDKGITTIQEALPRTLMPVPTRSGPNPVTLVPVLTGDVRIMALPAGQDPDEVIRASVRDWQHRVEAAVPVLDWLCSQAYATVDLNSAHGKSQVLARLGPVLAAIPDPVAREHYVQDVARRTRLPVDLVREKIGAAPHGGISEARQIGDETPDPEEAPVGGISEDRHIGLNEYILGFCTRYPDAIDVQDSCAAVLTAADFPDPVAREVFRALRRLADTGSDLDGLPDMLSRPGRLFIDTVAAAIQQEPAVPEYAVAAVMQKMLNRLHREQCVAQLDRTAQALEAYQEDSVQDTHAIMALVTEINVLRKTLKELDAAVVDMDAASRRPWETVPFPVDSPDTTTITAA